VIAEAGEEAGRELLELTIEVVPSGLAHRSAGAASSKAGSELRSRTSSTTQRVSSRITS